MLELGYALGYASAAVVEAENSVKHSVGLEQIGPLQNLDQNSLLAFVEGPYHFHNFKTKSDLQKGIYNKLVLFEHSYCAVIGLF